MHALIARATSAPLGIGFGIEEKLVAVSDNVYKLNHRRLQLEALRDRSIAEQWGAPPVDVCIKDWALVREYPTMRMETSTVL